LAPGAYWPPAWSPWASSFYNSVISYKGVAQVDPVPGV